MTLPTGRGPNYRALAAGLVIALAGGALLSAAVDLTAGLIFVAFATLLGGLAAVFTGDLSLPRDYEIPHLYIGEHGWKQWVKWPPGRRRR
jgi:hypothetical protein